MHVLKNILCVLNTYSVYEITRQIQGICMEIMFFYCYQITKTMLRKIYGPSLGRVKTCEHS